MTRSRWFISTSVLLLATMQAAAQPRPSHTITPATAADVHTDPAAARVPAPALVGDVAHGEYLAEHVAMCVECHSERDPQGHIIPDQRYMGGAMLPGPAWAPNWALRAPRNKGLLGYSQDQAMRLLTQGAINREGRQLQPPMPRFRMSPQDAADVIAFLRSLP